MKIWNEIGALRIGIEVMEEDLVEDLKIGIGIEPWQLEFKSWKIEIEELTDLIEEFGRLELES